MPSKVTAEGPSEVSVEEYARMKAAGNIPSSRPAYTKPAIRAALTAGLLLIGFFCGIAYEKGKITSSNNTTVSSRQTGTQNGFGSNSGQSGFGGRTGVRAGGFGIVTSVSSTSITMSNTRSGSNQTYKITSSTAVTNNDIAATISDIKTGDTVMVRTSSSDTSMATSILLNPSFGGGSGPMPGNQDGGSSTDSQGTSSGTATDDSSSQSI